MLWYLNDPLLGQEEAGVERFSGWPQRQARYSGALCDRGLWERVVPGPSASSRRTTVHLIPAAFTVSYGLGRCWIAWRLAVDP